MPTNYMFLVRDIATGHMKTVVSTSERAAIKQVNGPVGSRWAIKLRGIGGWTYFTLTKTGYRTLK